MNSSPNYFVVGATFEDADGTTYPMDKELVEQGIWTLGWRPPFGEHPNAKQFYESANQIQRGDRIAIKKMDGKGGVNILHIGIAKKPFKIDDTIICSVDWINIESFPDRKAGLNGWVGAAYGPYSRNKGTSFEDFGLDKVFCL